MKKRALTFNDYEKIRNFTRDDYNKVLQQKPDNIAGFKYEIVDDKIFLLDNQGYSYELIPKEDRKELIKHYFFNPQTTGSYKKIYNLLLDEYAGISRQNVIDVIRTFESYQQRKHIPIRKSVRPIITNGPFERWQMDLIIFEKYAEYNKNNKYLLVVVDTFSKYTFIKILPNKSSRTIASSLIAIFEETKQKYGKVPKLLTSDNAKEFKSEIIKKLCERYKIQQKFSFPYSPQEQGQVERRNQDIKNIIFKHFINTKTYRYIDIINQILYNININTVNKTTGLTPDQIMRNREHDDQIVENMKKIAINRANKIIRKAPMFKVGDKVRIALPTKLYTRKTNKQQQKLENLNVGVKKWSDTVYTIIEINNPKEKWQQPLYKLDNKEIYNPYML